MFTIFFNGKRYEVVPHTTGVTEERDGWMKLAGAATIEEAQSAIQKDRDFYRSLLRLC
jgi:hypothetical protein